jgi:hypothetical protein
LVESARIASLRSLRRSTASSTIMAAWMVSLAETRKMKLSGCCGGRNWRVTIEPVATAVIIGMRAS